MERKLAEQVANIQQATKREEEAEAEREKITECLQATQKELEGIIQAQQEEQEKREESELYIQVQEETYVDFIAKVEMSREELDRKYRDLEEKYKKTRHILIVVEARLRFDHDTIENLWQELLKEIDPLKYKNYMGKEKVQAILMWHKEQPRLMVSKSLDKGWKTWSTQATELQILRADYKNRKEGWGFFKMDDNNIQLLREDLTK